MGILQSQIAATMQVNLPGSLFWSKDVNSKFLGNNISCGRFFGFKYANDMIGCSDYELRCDAAAMAPTFQNCDQRVMTTNSVVKFFEVLKSASHEIRIIVINKMPLLDDDKQIVGTFAHGMDVTEPFFKLGCLLGSEGKASATKLVPVSFVLGGSLQREFNLTDRQAECLFYLLRYKTIKQVAALFNVSARTIEEHIDKLKHKFNCHSKRQLLEKASSHGFLQFIPESIFNNQLSLTLE